MKRFLAGLWAGMAVLGAQAREVDVGLSVQIGQPGFYGRIDIGDAPRPRLIYAEPLIVSRPPPRLVYEPVYLRVPPGHERHWRRHCHRYEACGRPVYFVRDDWYQRVYVPHYRHRHPDYRHERRDDWRGDGREGRGRGHGRD